MIYKPNFFIITGGPGVGKTTLLEVLAKQGFPYVPEVARKIIREQVSQNGDALPWANIPAYTHLMLSRSVESFEQHQKQESVLFFDRGIPSLTPTLPTSLYYLNSDILFKPFATIRRYSSFLLGPKSTKPIPNVGNPTKKPSRPTISCSPPTNS